MNGEFWAGVWSVVRAVVNKSNLEVLYFLSGPFLVWVAYKGLKGLKFSKDAVKVSNEAVLIAAAGLKEARESNRIATIRESNHLALRMNEYFAEKIVPLFVPFDEGDYPQLKEPEVYIDSNNMVSVQTEGELPPFPKDAEAPLRKLVNSMAIYSSYFVEGDASDDLGFSACGPLYCQVLELMAPMVMGSIRSQHNQEGPTAAFLTLYLRWKPRLPTPIGLEDK